MTEADFALLGIDSATVLAVWGWGFASVVLAWSFGYVIGVAVDVIRKA
jgi:hypothetical protein